MKEDSTVLNEAVPGSFFYLDEIIIHYGVEHHRVQNIIFNHLRRTSIHEEHRRDCDRFLQQIEKLKNEADEEYKKMEEDRQKIKRLEMEMDSKSKLLEEKLQEVAKLEGKLKEKNKKMKIFISITKPCYLFANKKKTESFI